ncbi:MAG: AsmA-like C-terminal region-containing protein [Syntrophales bacterium]|nr:AsmA-like C-terminal region-containing protein [Syntrophales bacterium]MDD5533596.1 AsmA-like C-terminal region-containing protein [Syntrophales bacterium]
MKKSLKIAIIAAAVLLAAFASLYLFLRSYLTDERVRAIVSELAEKSLNRKVLLGEADLSLFRGIVVRGIEIKEKDGETAFVKAKEFNLMYRFLPLLSGRLVIGRLGLLEPEVYLKKNPDGSFNFSDIGVSGEERKKEAAGLPFSLDIKKLSIEKARISYADPKGNPKKAELLLNADLGIGAVSDRTLSSQGSFSLTIVEAVFQGTAGLVRDVRADVRYKTDLDLERERITLHSVDAEIMKIPLQLQGSIDYAAGPAYSLDLEVQNADLSNIRNELISAFLPGAGNTGGKATVMLRAERKPGKESPVLYKGDVKLNRVSFAYKGIRPVMDGSLKLAPEVITIERIRLIAGDSSADITGSVKNYGAYPDADIDVRSESLPLDQLIVPAAPVSKPQTPGTEPEPMNLKMRVSASLDIRQTQYKGIPIKNLKSRLELKENVLRIVSLTGNTLSGSFTLSGAANLARRGTAYNMAADLKGVRIEELVDAFAPPRARGKLLGILSGNAELSGAGTLPANVKRNLKGKGSFAVRNGSLRNAELSSGLLALLGLQDLREIPIQTAEGRFTVSGGIVNLRSLVESRDLGLEQTGTIGLDEKLDLGILVKVSERLAPKLVSQSAVARFLSSEKGWTSVPLRVRGTISDPSYSVDVRAAGRKAGEGVRKKLQEELLRRLPGAPEKAPDKDQKGIPAPGDVLKELFGK